MSALLLAGAQGFTSPATRALGVAHRPAVVRASPLAVGVPPEFATASQSFGEAADAGLDFQFFLSLGLVFSLGFTASQKFGTPAEEAAGASKAKDKEPTEFGWIHADHRVPLPTLAELD